MTTIATEAAASGLVLNRIHPEALRAVADAAARHEAYAQVHVRPGGVAFAVLWAGPGPGEALVGFAAATSSGACVVGVDAVAVYAEAVTIADFEQR